MDSTKSPQHQISAHVCYGWYTILYTFVFDAVTDLSHNVFFFW